MNLAKILLVDDLDHNLLALEGLLKREDISIFKANSGTDALNLMISHEFALAIVDVRMPIMSGFELAELMRGTNKTKHIPIIFVTAAPKDQWSLFKSYESGAIDFLSKPLDPHAVKNKVNVFIELYQQTKELKKTQVDLEKAVSIRDEFMSIASHELKTPLTSMYLQSQLRMRILTKDESSSFTLERLAKMFADDLRQVKKIIHLVDDMLDVARISSGKLSMRAERFDLCELVKELLERTSEQFIASGCPIKIKICERMLGNWDRFRIEQVIINLFTNAMRYGQGKEILVEVNEIKDGAQIIVRDQGRGIAKKDQQRIFDKFERAAGHGEIAGLGLGLYIVKEILESHQGSIKVESDLGCGSAFIVEIPSNGTFTPALLTSKCAESPAPL